MTPSPLQLLIVGLIILVLFGASRLGEVGKGLGDGIRNFKKGLSGDDEDESDGDGKQAEAKQIKGEETKASESSKEEDKEPVPEKKEKA
jgi:sec-independent protein translocase protein TatA